MIEMEIVIQFSNRSFKVLNCEQDVTSCSCGDQNQNGLENPPEASGLILFGKGKKNPNPFHWYIWSATKFSGQKFASAPALFCHSSEKLLLHWSFRNDERTNGGSWKGSCLAIEVSQCGDTAALGDMGTAALGTSVGRSCSLSLCHRI